MVVRTRHPPAVRTRDGGDRVFLVNVPTVATHLDIEGVAKEQASGGQKGIYRVITVANRPKWRLLVESFDAPCNPEYLLDSCCFCFFTITTSQTAFSEFGVGNLTSSIADGPNRLLLFQNLCTNAATGDAPMPKGRSDTFLSS
jgi:hypothetical protein